MIEYNSPAAKHHPTPSTREDAKLEFLRAAILLLRRRRSVYVALLFLGVVHVLLQLVIAFPIQWNRDDWEIDTLFYYTAADRVRAGEALYWAWPDYGPHMLTNVAEYPYERHPYPPFIAPALAPLTIVPYVEFARFAYIPLFLAFWIYAGCIARLAVGRLTASGVLIAGQILAITPGSYMALSLGQPAYSPSCPSCWLRSYSSQHT